MNNELVPSTLKPLENTASKMGHCYLKHSHTYVLMKSACGHCSVVIVVWLCAAPAGVINRQLCSSNLTLKVMYM